MGPIPFVSVTGLFLKKEGLFMGKEEKKDPEKPRDPKSFGGDKKFFRDGAKYVCDICKQKFFTRVEVEKCFDNH
jgi:hypothetical protein